MSPLQVGLVDRIAAYVQRTLIPNAIDFVADLVVFVVVFLIVYVAGRAIVLPALERVMVARDLSRTLVKPARKLGAVGIAFAAVAVAFAVAGFGNLLTSLATLAAALTLAVGFASQDLIGNLVAGAFLIGDPKIDIGDWVEWNGHTGVIEDISFRVSRVRTFDNELITVPNSELANTAIVNPVAKDKLRIQFLFGIGYDDDIDHATDVILDEAEAHEEILADPEPSVRVTELADSYVGLKSRFWIDQPARSDFVRVRSEYVQAVKERCDAEEIEMPYPYTELTGGIEVDGPAPDATAD